MSRSVVTVRPASTASRISSARSRRPPTSIGRAAWSRTSSGPRIPMRTPPLSPTLRNGRSFLWSCRSFPAEEEGVADRFGDRWLVPGIAEGTQRRDQPGALIDGHTGDDRGDLGTAMGGDVVDDVAP